MADATIVWFQSRGGRWCIDPPPHVLSFLSDDRVRSAARRRIWAVLVLPALLSTSLALVLNSFEIEEMVERWIYRPEAPGVPADHDRVPRRWRPFGDSADFERVAGGVGQRVVKRTPRLRGPKPASWFWHWATAPFVMAGMATAGSVFAFWWIIILSKNAPSRALPAALNAAALLAGPILVMSVTTAGAFLLIGLTYAFTACAALVGFGIVAHLIWGSAIAARLAATNKNRSTADRLATGALAIIVWIVAQAAVLTAVVGLAILAMPL